MATDGFAPMFGVVGLTGAEQRGARGGNRASCIRNAYATYISNIRSGSSRSSARSTLLGDLACCNQLSS